MHIFEDKCLLPINARRNSIKVRKLPRKNFILPVKLPDQQVKTEREPKTFSDICRRPARGRQMSEKVYY